MRCLGVIDYGVAAGVRTLLLLGQGVLEVRTIMTDLLEQPSSVSTLFWGAADLKLRHCDATARAFLEQV